MRAAGDLREAGADILLFAGGYSTARNILGAVGLSIPVIGIPAGCKIHSAVYAVNPKKAGKLTVKYLRGGIKGNREAEVMDIDEELFRRNIVEARLYGYLSVPNERGLIQNLKSGRGSSEKGSIEMLSNYVCENLLKGTLHIIWPGSTTRAVIEKLGLGSTLLGVDLIYNRAVIKNDAAEQDILAALDSYGAARIVVTVIGGQGFIFGRGSQQISAAVLSRVGKENIIIAASRDKMLSLMGGRLYIDTGDGAVNNSLRGYYKVITGYEEYVMFEADV